MSFYCEFYLTVCVSYILPGFRLYRLHSTWCCVSFRHQRRRGWIILHSLHNLHGDGVEHPDKTLLFGGIERRQVVHLIKGTMPIVSTASVFDFGRWLLTCAVNVNTKYEYEMEELLIDECKLFYSTN